jgi:uncharacterized membrane protein YecN with MAPEG domain
VQTTQQIKNLRWRNQYEDGEFLTMITALYASLLTLWLVLLSFRVIALRGSPVFGFLNIDTSDDDMLQRAIRAHGNLTEYAPMMLILLYLLEVSGGDTATLHSLGLCFFIGRLMHGICFGFMRSSMPLRIGGTVLTLTPLLVAAVMLGLTVI